MPVLPITSVDASTDTLTIVGHGLVTGDGPGAVRNIGGALPGGLTRVTDYFAIRVDADHLKLAASNPLAIAGTPVDITTTGSGTNVLQLGLPYRRPRTLAAGSQIRSADLNSDWDAMVAVYAALTGQPQSLIDSPITLVSAAAGQLTSVGVGGGAQYDGTAWFLSTSGAAQGPVFAVPVIALRELSTIKVYGHRGNATGGVKATYTIRNMITNAIVATGNASQTTGISDFTLLITAGLPAIITPDCSLSVATENTGGAGSGNSVFGVGATFT